ncbi:hypothetical protein [Streptomyces sp. NPDC058620]|uniref:hypothetical protein n=1 Tax=Streptomyces sp. NPDC058620 TaxID=3346560 RepID=UPI0036537008
MNETTTMTSSVESAGPAGDTALRRLLDPGNLPAAATAAAAGLSVASPWWAVPTVITAFLSGRQPGRVRPAALVLVAFLAAGVVAVSLVPSWLPLGSRFVGVVIFAAMPPWFVGRFWRQYQELTRAGWRPGRSPNSHAREQRGIEVEPLRELDGLRMGQQAHWLLLVSRLSTPWSTRARMYSFRSATRLTPYHWSQMSCLTCRSGSSSTAAMPAMYFGSGGGGISPMATLFHHAEDKVPSLPPISRVFTCRP